MAKYQVTIVTVASSISMHCTLCTHRGELATRGCHGQLVK